VAVTPPVPTSGIGAEASDIAGALGQGAPVFTEGLGPQLHLGRVVLLLNEHSASASEMVAAFASEYKLATLVGVKTPGKLVAASSFKVGHGYRMALPVGAYFTWSGTKLEGHGVSPDVEAPLSIETL
jgi:carboxyl-terminal processing protease